jgi:hypothetical protein
MSEKTKRLEKLGQRFSQRSEDAQENAAAPKSNGANRVSEVNRRRHSVYIDESLMNHIDRVFKELQHEAYPAEIKKSTFLEMLLEKGLNDLDAIKETLVPHYSA